MKIHQFIVTLTFDGKITSNEEIQQLAQNIADSLKHTSDTAGLTPDDSETYTSKIEVTPQFLPDAKVGYEIQKASWKQI